MALGSWLMALACFVSFTCLVEFVDLHMVLGSWLMAFACFVSFMFLVEFVDMFMTHGSWFMVHGSCVFRFLHVLG